MCFLHHLEKPFEHLFEFYDGKTTGPNTYSGPIVKLIEGDNVHDRAVVEFEKIENPDLLEKILKIR